jgi:hypothetical protein
VQQPEEPPAPPVATSTEQMQEITPTPRKIPVGKWPEGITLAPDGLWVAESGIRQMSRINLAKSAIDKTVKTGRLPVQLATDASGNVFANTATEGKIFRQSVIGKGKAIASFPKFTNTADIKAQGDRVFALTSFDNPDRKFTVNAIQSTTGQLNKSDEVSGDPRALGIVGDDAWVLYGNFANGNSSELVYFARSSASASAPIKLEGFGFKMANNAQNLYIGGQVEQQVGEALVFMVSGIDHSFSKVQSLKTEELITAIAASETHVVAMTSTGNSWILDANTLQPLKHFNAGAPAQTAIIAGGSLYFTTHNGKGGNGAVYVFDDILN